MTSPMPFDRWFATLTGHESPRDWQTALAAESTCRDRLIRTQEMLLSRALNRGSGREFLQRTEKASEADSIRTRTRRFASQLSRQVQEIGNQPRPSTIVGEPIPGSPTAPAALIDRRPEESDTALHKQTVVGSN